MAYKIKRQQRIQEDLELVNDDGSIYAVISTNITADSIAKDFRACQVEIIHAQQNIKSAEDINKAHTELGNAIIKMFRLIFGDAQTETILEFYENNYIEMATNVMGFIDNVIVPAIVKAVAERKAEIKRQYASIKGRK